MTDRPDIAALVRRRLRALRTGAGLTQEQLGARCGLGASEVSKYESGRKVPTLPTVGRLAVALGVSPAALVQEPADGVAEDALSMQVARVRLVGEAKVAEVVRVLQALLHEDEASGTTE